MNKNLPKCLNKKRHGFTLIELLVVIALIALLTTISAFGLANARQGARDGKRKADLEAIRSALEIYRTDCDTYPASINFGGALNGANGSGTRCLTSYSYMTQVPTDPGGGTYRYNRTSTTTYELCSTLEQPPSGATTVSCAGSATCGGGSCYYRVINP